MTATRATVVGMLQEMHTNLKNSPYFGPEDLVAIQAEIARQSCEHPDEQRLREMIQQREALLVQHAALVATCPELFEHFAQNLEDMQDELNRMIHERELHQRARVDYNNFTLKKPI